MPYVSETDHVTTSAVLLLQVVLTISKPGEKGDVPVGVIAGSVIAGLLLLALAVGLLWKVTVCLRFGGNNYFRYLRQA